MTKSTAWLLTKWIGTGTEADPFRPEMLYNVESTTDVVGLASEQMIAAPNSTTVEVVIDDVELAKVPTRDCLWSEAIVDAEAI